MIEVLGIIASVLILISFTMKDVIWIRIINIFGAILMVVYGILLHAFSVYFLNSLLILVHLFYLSRFLYDKKKSKIQNKENDIL